MDYFHWNASPVIFELGFLKLRWYGLIFVGSFFIALNVGRHIFKKENHPTQMLDDLLFYTLIGTIIGARLMHCFAYEPEFFLSHPIEILKIYNGGLASHGGFLGVIVALWLFSKSRKLSFAWLLSRIAILAPIVAASVRIGNFFNSEILGLPTTLPWAVVFERIDPTPRHPVQLYEALCYGVLFLLLYTIWKRNSAQKATRLLPPVFLVGMFSARFLLEYTKTHQASYHLSLPLSTGQLLSLPLVVIGIAWLGYALTRKD